MHNRIVSRPFAVVLLFVIGAAAARSIAQVDSNNLQPDELSRYMNSLPVGKEFFCVGNGPTNAALHPDRAPYTDLAMQNGVVLFTGTAPQQGLNFRLTAGSLVYRNQMSTLGSTEPPPQVGASGLLLQSLNDEKEYLPWTEARWHPGEDITWYGIRENGDFMEGLPLWSYDTNSACDNPQEMACDAELRPLFQTVHEPPILDPFLSLQNFASLARSFNLQLSRGIYQVAKVRDYFNREYTECPYAFREPWFQARGESPAFDVHLGGISMADTLFPTFHNIYTYRQLLLDGGQLIVNFERSATWPRREHSYPGGGLLPAGSGGGKTGLSMAEAVLDEYGNKVEFDRVPMYQWETDFKQPQLSTLHKVNCAIPTEKYPGSLYPRHYEPLAQAWRLPHKRLRSVKLKESGATDPGWTVVFVHEHPESDRISRTDTPDAREWKSIYSHMPQTQWVVGNLPPLPDETTLLTVQAYRAEQVLTTDINGDTFQDDYSVWASDVDPADPPLQEHWMRVNDGIEYLGDYNGDGRPGIANVDDDGDGMIDEDCNDLQPWENGYDPICMRDDDNEDKIVEWQVGRVWHGITDPAHDGRTSTDPFGDANGDGCPGLCDVDDDGDGLIDEDSNGYLKYLNQTPGTTCDFCQNELEVGWYDPSNDTLQWSTTFVSRCLDANGNVDQTHTNTGCTNPLYGRDNFAHYDDDEDGIFDEDGDENPLLVRMRSLDGECSAGKHPYVPRSATLPDGGGWTEDCRPVYDADDDLWTYQVQYVYSRSNPFWLLSLRDTETVPSRATFGTVDFVDTPRYYYFPPLDPDVNGDGDLDDLVYDLNDNGQRDTGDVTEADLDRVATGTGDFAGMIVDASTEETPDGLPNVHPDCLPHPDFRGPQGKNSYVWGDFLNPTPPSDVHLIKRIVRMREDVENDPRNIIEQVWLYRYNDFGFVKAIFDPESVLAIIDASSTIDEPDDILQHADTFDVGGRPLITYASNWYTYYNPYILNDVDPADYWNNDGLPYCYDEPPFIGTCFADPDDPTSYMMLNGCDGEYLWDDGYQDEMHIDPDCSEMMRQDCGSCFARYACTGSCSSSACECDGGQAVDANYLAQLGIPGAQPRLRRYQIKTARVRGADGETHLYRFDYLGAAGSVYTENARITSYADPHNITIVDELVEQTAEEFASPGDFAVRNEFYLYEDDFQLDLDARESPPTGYSGAALYGTSTHALHVPVKVKTRRVVTMNYYGIAISDRLILTPGYIGDSTSLVDDQQYELTNVRGQTKHVYDPSWVAGLRVKGFDWIKDAGRVYTELFGGDEGWYSVLTGVAWGSGGGNLYNQQCRTPEIVEDVPVQRVRLNQLHVVSATQMYGRNHDGNSNTEAIKDMPEFEAVYYADTTADTLTIDDAAGTLGDNSGIGDGTGCFQNNCQNDPGAPEDCNANDDCIGCTECSVEGGVCVDWLVDIDLHLQDSVVVTVSGGGNEDDGISLIRYAYDFWDAGAPGAEVCVRWKWRWQEKVSAAKGGTGYTALEMWYFDPVGRLRLHGRGSGTIADRPVPVDQFFWTYFGYDQYGRIVTTVVDVKISNLPTMTFGGSFMPVNVGGETPAEFSTVSVYNNLGMLVSRRAGFDDAGWDPNPDTGDDAIRTDYKLLSNRVITYTDADDHTQIGWQDPYIYRIEYNAISAGGFPEAMHQVNGTTTVTILTKSGKFLERRVIAWNGARADSQGQSIGMNDKITDFGWAISLTDYTSDAAVDALTYDDIPADLVADSCPAPPPEGCTPQPPPDCCGDGTQIALQPGTSPGFPDDIWPAENAEYQIVTLARIFKQYGQSSTLKPTSDLVFRSFDLEAPPTGDDPRVVRRNFLYDLEDRIAREEQPDGTITRILFDPKRRPTKLFQGSGDDCQDWFPATPMGGADDMLLTTQQLYNDGFEDREYNPLLSGASDSPAANDDFPNDANQLVRVRRFTDAAETCTSAYDPETNSRDTIYTYDWRGRVVISTEVAVGYNGGTLASPTVIQASTVVYDNLGRPVLAASWPASNIPDLEDIDDGTNMTGWAHEDPDTATTNILGFNGGPLSLSRSFYDDRGREYETRTYDVSVAAGTRYTYSKIFRDDLNRVASTVTPTGVALTTYDSLGRVPQTQRWSAGNPTDGTPASGAIELTRTETTHDAFGNVQTQVHYQRLADSSSPLALGATNSIRTFTHNWYDNARRLAATVSFGTNDTVNGGYAYGNDPFDYDADEAPTWDKGLGEYKCSPGAHIDCPGEILDTLVTEFGYDLAGRRIWTRDPAGRIARTWYDLLGRTLLTAENWLDPDGLLTEQPSPDSLTRFTAHHYTRGGLLDMIVAIIPTDPEDTITPADIDWDDGDENTDFAAGTIAAFPPADFTLQATRFTYDAEVYAENEHSTDISIAPSMISGIEYPNATTGQPDPLDDLDFTYTMSGQVASRTDQRGVKLDFSYGNDTASQPSESLTEVSVTIPVGSGVDDAVQKLAFSYDDQGRLSTAATLDQLSATLSSVAYTYDAVGNLTRETLDPDVPNPGKSKYVDYGWDTTATGNLLSHLLNVTYHSGRGFDYDYDEPTPDRMTGLTEQSADAVIAYAHTGGGRSVTKTWGAAKVELSYTGGGLDRFGRITEMVINKVGTPSVQIQKYGYDYDKNGNRKYAYIEQAGHANDRSFLYGYDELNRLQFAEHGELKSTNDGFADRTTPEGRVWNLDVLGNWSAGDAAGGSVIDYDGDLTPGYDTQGDVFTLRQHHNVNSVNEVVSLVVDNGTPTPFTYDDAGSITDDGTFEYVYDAWNRIVEVKDSSSVLVAAYSFDALGRRISKAVGATNPPVTYYYYDGNRVIEQHTDDGHSFDLDAQYVYGLDYIDEPVAKLDSAGVRSYIFQDANFNVVGVTDATGALSQQYAYNPYGTLLATEDASGNDLGATPLAVEMLHQGLWYNAEVETYHNRAREYNPKLGRFMQRDPYQTALLLTSVHKRNARTRIRNLVPSASEFFADGMSTYAYIGLNPISGHDPSGQFSLLDHMKAMTISGYIAASNWLYLGVAPTGIAGAIAKVVGGAFNLMIMYSLATDTETQDMVFAMPGGPQMISALVVRSIVRAPGGIMGVIRQAQRWASGSWAVEEARILSNQVAKGIGSIWEMGLAARGLAAEDIVVTGATKMPKGFPGIDFFNYSNGTGISVKTMDLRASSYQTAAGIRSKVGSFINRLLNFQAGGGQLSGVKIKPGMIKNLEIHVGIPPGVQTVVQQGAMLEMVEEASLNGMTLKFLEVG